MSRTTTTSNRWIHYNFTPLVASPIEVSAPPVPRLFDDTLYGITVWVCFLYERYACYRPLNAVAAWLSERGLALSPGTLADSVKRFLPLFERKRWRCTTLTSA